MGQHNKLYTKLPFLISLLALILNTGCANLESVRDFSKQSANLAAGPEAIDYWANWNSRSERFDDLLKRLPGEPAGPTKPLSPPDPELIKSIKALQLTLAAYLTKLGALAQDDIVDVSDKVKDLETNLNKLPFEGTTAEKAEIIGAYGEILKLVKLPLDAYRHYKIKQLIEENNNNIKALTDGLSKAMDSVSKIIASEQLGVDNWYKDTTVSHSDNFSEAYQWAKNRETISAEYKEKIKAIDAYKNALTTIGKMHGEMALKLSTFNSDSFKRLVVSLNQARDEIKSAHDKYEKAFE